MANTSIEDAHAYCAEVSRRSGSSFLAAFWLFPPAQRRGLHAIYAFCRLADDIADDPEVKSDRLLLLARWRDLLSDAYLRKSEHPVGIALGDTAHRYQLKQSWFDDLLAGIESDLRGETIERFEDLERYCYRVAGTVGLMVLALRGLRGPHVESYAMHLGIGVQLTNILRDVREDAVAGRAYFSQEDMHHFGVDPDQLIRSGSNPNVARLMAKYATLARGHYERSQACLPLQDRAALRPAQAMGSIYRDLLRALEASNFVAPVPVRTSKLRRIAVATRGWITGDLT